MKKLFFFLPILLFLGFLIQTKPEKPLTYFKNPEKLLQIWDSVPYAVNQYTDEEKKAQLYINATAEDAVMTYAPLNGKNEWIDVDYEEITPFTWKWVEFELKQADGLSIVNLRRPNWWLKKVGADSIGKEIYLDMPEVGIIGWSKVKEIRVNQLDTRFWDESRLGDYVSRPITGRFEHESNTVLELRFANNKEPLGVTNNHPIWSIDRNGWVEAGKLKIGEKVKTYSGELVLQEVTKLKGKHKVYNLEIYRDHNFMVSLEGILVHNECVNLKDIVSWSSKKGKTFGHTFTQHGKNQKKSLLGRLQDGEQGRFLDDDKVAEYIESLGGEIDQLKPGEAMDFDLPEGLGEVISGKQGSEIITPATKIRIVRGTTKSNSFIKTAYPIR